MEHKSPGALWRVFSILMLVAVVPFESAKLFVPTSGYNMARYIIDTIGTIGLFGYAFGRSMGPQTLWRAFAPVFVIFSVGVAATGAPGLLKLQKSPPAVWVMAAIMLLIAAIIVWAMSVALLRHGGWLRATDLIPAVVDDVAGRERGSMGMRRRSIIQGVHDSTA